MGHKQWALMHELREDVEPTLLDLLSKLQKCDLVLIEGFKQGDFPKLEVWRAAVGKPHLWPNCNGIVAMATDGGASVAALPTLDLSDIAGIADFIDKHAASSASMLARNSDRNGFPPIFSSSGTQFS